MEAQDQYMAFKPTLLMRLFPGRHCFVSDHPEFDEGYLTVETIIVCDWLDRLRMLVSGKARITVKTATDVPVNKATSVSAFSVLPPNYKVEPRK